MTAVAQSTLIVNLVPIALPFFLLALAGERLNGAEVAGTLLAILGLVGLSVKDALWAAGEASPGTRSASSRCSSSRSTWRWGGATGIFPRSGST